MPTDRSAPPATDERSPAPPAHRIGAILIGAALLSGALLRLLQYLGNRSLWLDEALMVPGFLGRSLREVLDPATWGPIPPGFLLLENLVSRAFGSGELALRLLPLVAGVASLGIFVAVARRALSAGGVVVAVWLFALSPFLVYYSSELKPYSTDVLAALAFLWAAFELHENRVTARRGAAWAVAGITAAFFSQTVVFVLGGTFVALALLLWRAGRRGELRILLLPLGIWTVAFVPPLLVLTRNAGSGGYMQAFWSSGFMPLPPRGLADLAWFADAFARLFRDPLGVLGDAPIDRGFYQAAAGMFAFVAGCSWAWSQRRDTLLILALPILVTLLASGLELYPFGGEWTTSGRVILFLTPGLFLLMGQGAARLVTAVKGLGVFVVVLLLVPAAAFAVLAVPNGRTEIRPLLAAVASARQADARVYVDYTLTPAFRYYQDRFGFDADEVVLGVCARFEPLRYIAQLNTLRGTDQAWILLAEGEGARGFDERGLMLDYLDHIGERRREIPAQGVTLYEYDLSADAGSTEPFRASIPDLPPSLKEGCAVWN